MAVRSGVRMIVHASRGFAALGLVAACGVVDEARELLRGDAPAEPVVVEPEASAAEPFVREPDVPTQGVLGSEVAHLLEASAEPEPDTRGADLELVEGITVTRIEGGWTHEPTGSYEGTAFTLDLDVKVGEEIGLNDARLVAKATCLVDAEARASSADVVSPGAAHHYGGPALVSADPGEHAGAHAKLFMQQDIVGHEPCQVEMRLVSAHTDEPMRVDGLWCVRDGLLEEGACKELAPPKQPKGFVVRDWKIDRTRRGIEFTLQVDERVRMDRVLVFRSSCDDGGERVARTQMIYGPNWGLVDPGDSVRVSAQNYGGWFATEGPCELTAELWRHDDRGVLEDPREVGVACVRRFLPEDGHCSPAAAPPVGAGPVTLRRFEPEISRDPYDRRTRVMQAEVELVAHEDIGGRYRFTVSGTCGKGRGSSPLYLGSSAVVDASLLRAGEVMKVQYRGYVGRRSSKCEVDVKLEPNEPSGTQIPLGKYCVDEKTSKTC